LLRRAFLLGILFFAAASVATPIKSIEDKLNSIKTLQADFVQEDSKNKVLKGSFYLSRPGKLKFSYEEPSPFLLIADGDSLIYEDHITQKTSYFPLTAGPAALLLEKEIKFGEKHRVLKVWTEGPLLKVSFEGEEGFQGILYFDPSSLDLRGWETLDVQGNRIKIFLNNRKLNTKLSDSLFSYKQKPRWQAARERRRA
jgi:outer membrane lipoprotein-sorting protein